MKLRVLRAIKKMKNLTLDELAMVLAPTTSGKRIVSIGGMGIPHAAHAVLTNLFAGSVKPHTIFANAQMQKQNGTV